MKLNRCHVSAYCVLQVDSREGVAGARATHSVTAGAPHGTPHHGTPRHGTARHAMPSAVFRHRCGCYSTQLDVRVDVLSSSGVHRTLVVVRKLTADNSITHNCCRKQGSNAV